ncbi:MAG: TonB-dependent receptor [Candidatus Latescibacteria bacterium]|nr:TonB-dependent receptor [Candidatus Latescibacterota bacterium]
MEIEETHKGATTGEEGLFQLDLPPPGNYTLSISFVGYHSQRLPIEVQAGEPTPVLVQLEPEPIQLQSILVQADPAAISAASSRTLRAFDLRTRPRASSRDLLQVVPGLFTAQHSGGKAQQLFLRGFDGGFGTDVAVAVDGMPINLVSHGHGQGYADLNFLIPETVERLEVFKGPYSAQYGNLANAGQLILTTHDRLDQNTLRIERGRFNTARYTALYQVSPDSAQNSAYFAGDYQLTDGPFDQPEDLQRLSLYAKVYHRLPGEAELRAALSGFSSSWDASSQLPSRAVESGRISRWGTINPAEGGHTARHNLMLSYTRKGHSGAEGFAAHAYLCDYNLKLYSDYSFFLQDPIFGDMVEQSDDRYLAGLQAQYHLAHRLGPLLARWQGGGGFRADNVALELWQVVQRRRYWPLLDARVQEHNSFLWGQEELAWGPQWRLILGLRADYFTFEVEDRLEMAQPSVLPLSEWLRLFQQRDNTPRPKALHVPLVQPHASGVAQAAILSPKANLIYAAGPGLDLFANFGTGFHSNDARSAVIGRFVREQSAFMALRGGTPSQIDAVLDTLNFDPALRRTRILPRTAGAELGFRARLQGSRAGSFSLGPSLGHYGSDVRFHAPALRLAERFTLGGALWWMDVQDEILYDPQLGTAEPRGRTRRWGVDLETRSQVGPWLWADVDLNWAHGRLRGAPAGADRIPLAPRFTSAGGLTLRPSQRFEAGLRYRHLSDRPATADGRLQAEGYTLFDLSASCHLGPFLLELAAENLLNTEWREAQFAGDSLLPGEGGQAQHGPPPATDINFVPGAPFNLRLGVSFFY